MTPCYRLSRIAAPTELPITLAEAREQLRVDTAGSPATSTEDDLISALIEAVTEEIDAGTGWLGRAIAPQTWRLSLPGFPACIVLPYPPFIDIMSFQYTDVNGATQTMVEGTDYRVIYGAGPAAEHAAIYPPFLGSFPAARSDFDTVLITYRCGYGAGSPIAADVPEIIKRYIKAALTSAYDSRDVAENELIGRGSIPRHVRNMLENIRVRNGPYA